MPDRLSALDASFLYLEEAATPMHVGGVGVFRVPDEGFQYDRLVDLIRDRIAFVPRYRQRLRMVPGNIGKPVWVDDARFDLMYHVRRSALPRPGRDEELWELVSRIMSRRLDRDRPLWEIYLVEGLQDDRFAILSKTHNALVDGVSAVEIGQVLLDVTPEPRPSPADSWRPTGEPSNLELVAGAVNDVLHRPAGAVDLVRGGFEDVKSTVSRATGLVGGLASVVRTAASPAPTSPLNVPIGKARRYTTVDTSLDDFRKVKDYHGTTVNDVVLAVVAGALRSWLQSRGEVVRPSTSLRAMVPVSIRNGTQPGGDRGADAADSRGNTVSAFFAELPVGEASPVVRLQRIAYTMGGLKQNGQAVGAQAITGVAGFAPPTVHAMAARAASDMSKRFYNLMITNVPGPQMTLYAGGAQMLSAYPVAPLAQGQALGVAVTSYDGGLFFGLTGDREAMYDIDVVARGLNESLDELVDTVRAGRPVARRRRGAQRQS
jgi:diacylglycerol O-acyltransferase